MRGIGLGVTIVQSRRWDGRCDVAHTIHELLHLPREKILLIVKDATAAATTAAADDFARDRHQLEIARVQRHHVGEAESPMIQKQLLCSQQNSYACERGGAVDIVTIALPCTFHAPLQLCRPFELCHEVRDFHKAVQAVGEELASKSRLIPCQGRMEETAKDVAEIPHTWSKGDHGRLSVAIAALIQSVRHQVVGCDRPQQEDHGNQAAMAAWGNDAGSGGDGEGGKRCRRRGHGAIAVNGWSRR